MAGFADIYGQESIKEHMQNAVRTGKISHAYILNGERNSGKEFIARLFAQTLQCENRKTVRTPSGEYMEPCGECHSCRQTESRNQPDIITLVHEKPNTISVDDIRTQINNDIMIKPYSSSFKVYLIGEAEKMTIQAQNALLKTLEEPPAYAVLLLLTANVESLLPTILSRCVVLHMKPVCDELVRSYLMEHVQVPDYKANICVAFARGNIGRARLLASSEEFDNVKSEAVILMKNIDTMNISEVSAAIKKIGEFKLDVNDYMDILSIWYRDVLLFKATNDVNHLIFKEEIQYIRKAADKASYEGLEGIIEGLEKAKSRLNANVNFDLTLELLLLTIMDAQKG